jgi:glycosyltransferase involved in cell wall biosynthesis
MVDHPIYHVKRLSRNIKNLICMFGDYEWSKYAKRYITNNNCYFVPFAAKKFNHTVEFTNRPIDILFAGGIQDPDKIRQSWSQSDTEVAAKMDNMVEEGLWDTNKTLRELWINQFGEELLMNPEMHKGGVDIILQEVDRYIRHYRRRKVVDTLLQSGAKLHICGDQWGWLDNKYDKQVELLGKVSFSSFIELMQQSKSVLNVNPGMTHGMHERILTAMMNGAISITDSNSYIDKEFVDLEDVVMYSYTDLDSAYEKIKGILTNDEYRYHITQNAMEKCKQRHTWKHRAQKIIRIVENHEKRLRI